MKNIILSFIVLSQFFFSQKKDSLKFVEKPKFETKKLIVPLSLMATGTAVLLTEKRDVPVVENKNFLDRKSTRLNSSHLKLSRMPSSA